MNRKVRAGEHYYYVPTLLDRCSPPYNVEEGNEVVVVNLHGCPKANTMGHCHVNHLNGEFAGLVCTNSLHTKAEYIEYLKKKIAEKEAAA
jgi:hypothetical protein